MGRNIELKARYPDLRHALSLCTQIGAVAASTQHQVDSYFRVASGRLKMRESTPGTSSLIYYRREDREGPRQSSYVKVDLENSTPELRELLAQALGMTVQVTKKRLVFILGQTRIHLDDVEGVGSFVEFEYVMHDAEPPEAGYHEVNRLKTLFGIDTDALVSFSYSDLVLGSGP